MNSVFAQLENSFSTNLTTKSTTKTKVLIRVKADSSYFYFFINILFAVQMDYESVAVFVHLCRVLVHLSRSNVEVSMFAPDIDQMHVVDHTKGKPMEPNRCGFFVCFVF